MIHAAAKPSMFPRSAWSDEKKQDLRTAIDASIQATGQRPQTPSRVPHAQPRYGMPMPEPTFVLDAPKMREYLRGTRLPQLPSAPILRGYNQQTIENQMPVDGPMTEVFFNARGQFYVRVTPGFVIGSREPRWYGPGQLPEDVKLDEPTPPPAPRYGLPMPRPDTELPPPSPRYGAPMPEDWK